LGCTRTLPLSYVPLEGVEDLIRGSAKRIEITFDQEETEKKFLEESKRGRV